LERILTPHHVNGFQSPSTMSRRVVRKAPWTERLQAKLNPLDWALWLSEELNSNDWEDFQKTYGTWIGVGVNFVFLIARANSGTSVSLDDDDVFGDSSLRRGSGWLLWFCRMIVVVLSIISTINAWYTFWKRKPYRLFERSVDDLPPTPSARRVRVDSSPVTNSPFRFIYNLAGSVKAEARAHPDPTREVTELAVWNPPPLCVHLFCLFSPAHILVYWSFLPVKPLDPYPSVTIAKTIFMATILSVQGHMLQSYYTQLEKDNRIVAQEVLREYDTKYVHPSINRPARDVGIQTPPRQRSKSPVHKEMGTDPMVTTEVDAYPAYTIINRGFRTNPNPAYAAQYDPDNTMHLQNTTRTSRSSVTPSFRTPATSAYSTGAFTTGASQADLSSPLRPSVNLKPPVFPSPQRPPSPTRHSMGGPLNGDGGSLGVYSHAASPLRKTASANHLRQTGDGKRERESSPLKRGITPGAENNERPGTSGALNQRLKDLRGEGGGIGRRQSGRF
jgi:hypothetical protein